MLGEIPEIKKVIADSETGVSFLRLKTVSAEISEYCCEFELGDKLYSVYFYGSKNAPARLFYRGESYQPRVIDRSGNYISEGVLAAAEDPHILYKFELNSNFSIIIYQVDGYAWAAARLAYIVQYPLGCESPLQQQES